MCPDSAPCWLLAFFPLFFTYKGTSNTLLVISLKSAAPHVGFFQVSSIPKWVFMICRLQQTLQSRYSYQNTSTDGQQHYRFHFSDWIMIKNSSVLQIQSSNGNILDWDPNLSNVQCWTAILQGLAGNSAPAQTRRILGLLLLAAGNLYFPTLQ